MTTAEANRITVRRFFEECWNRGDLALVSELLDQQHVHHLPNRDLRGPDEVKRFIERFRQTFLGGQFLIEDEIAAVNEVVIRWRFRGRHQPTGRSVDYTGIDLIRCDAGRIVELWAQYDSAGLGRQLA